MASNTRTRSANGANHVRRSREKVRAVLRVCLRQAIEKVGATQAAVARWIGINQSTLTRWLSGKRRVNLEAIMESRRFWPAFRECLNDVEGKAGW